MVVVGIIALLLGLSINGVDNLIQWSKLNRAAAILSSYVMGTVLTDKLLLLAELIARWFSVNSFRIKHTGNNWMRMPCLPLNFC
jgi:hypothetical protein